MSSQSHRATLLVLVLGAAGFVLLGQGVYLQNSKDTWPGGVFVGLGLLLFLLAYRVRSTRSLPQWLLQLAVWLRVQPAQAVCLYLAVGAAFAARFFAGNSSYMISPPQAWVAWSLAIGLVLVGTGQKVGWPTLYPRRELLALSILLGLALIVRVYDIGGLPAALTGDEGSTGRAAVDWVTGRLANPFVTAWYSFPSLFFAIPAVSIALFGHTYAALRLPAVLAGTLTVVGLYWFARPMFGRWVAALSAIWLASSHFHIHFSRIGLNNIWDGLFMVSVLGLFWRGWTSERRNYFVAAGLVLGFSQYFYTSARAIPIILLVWLALNWWFDRPHVRRCLPDLFHLFLVAFVTCLPLLLFYLGHLDQFSAPINRVSIFSRNWIEVTSARLGLDPWQLLLFNLRDAALAFTTVPLRSWYNNQTPLLLAEPAAFFILGVAMMGLKRRDPRHWLLGLWLLSMIVIAAFTESTPAGQRFVLGAPVAVLVAALGLVTISKWTLESWPGGRKWVHGLVILAVTVAVGADLRFYFWDYIPERGAGDVNTQVASQLASYLVAYPESSVVFFFGPPRMAYAGFSTLAFIAPQVKGIDVVEPLTTKPDWGDLIPPSAFVFLPERELEWKWVQLRYPGGSLRWFQAADGKRLFLLYEVR